VDYLRDPDSFCNTGYSSVTLICSHNPASLLCVWLQKLSKNVQDALAHANEVAEEVFSSMRTIRSFANESEEVSRYADRLNATYKLKLKESVAYAGYVWSNQVLLNYCSL